MRKALVSSKGQLTIPRAFRDRMQLTHQREVEMEQLDDGSVVIRPVRSILPLAGSLQSKSPAATPRQSRTAARDAAVKRHRRIEKDGT